MVGKRFMASCNPKKRIDVTNQVTQYPISNIQYPISNIQYPISNIQYPILIPVKPTLGVET
jgi:hypothetical protein